MSNGSLYPIPSKSDSVTIIGSGMAGIGLAKALRQHSKTCDITLITQDAGEEYSKPLLSSAFQKKQLPDAIAARDSISLSESLNIRMRTHTQVDAIDPTTKKLHLGLERLPYSRLVIASGAAPSCPPVFQTLSSRRVMPINDLCGYRQFRSLLSTIKQRPAHIAIVGSGLVGCEFANDLAIAGHQVTLIAPESTPLARLLPKELGEALHMAMSIANIRCCFNRQVTAVSEVPSTVELTLDDQQHISADIVLIATGLIPRSELARAAGLAVTANGITTNRQLETSVKDIYALGDVACVDGLNAMYVQPLQACVKALAATLSGTPTRVSYSAWPIIIKTPLLPLVVLPPKQTPVHWKISGEVTDFTALAQDSNGQLLGFALSGSRVRQKVELARSAPALLV